MQRAILLLTHTVGEIFEVENGLLLIRTNAIVLEHSAVHPCIITLHLQIGFRCYGVENEVVVTVGAIFVALLEFSGIFAEAFFAFFCTRRSFLALSGAYAIPALGGIQHSRTICGSKQSEWPLGR